MLPRRPFEVLGDRLATASIRRPLVLLAAWLGVVVLFTVTAPQLERVIEKDSTPFMPESTASVRALKVMDESFGDGRSNSFATVVLERDGGLQRRDRRYLDDLVTHLGTNPAVSYVQDVSDPSLRRALTSEDGAAVYFSIGLPGSTVAPSSIAQVESVREITETRRPAGLDVMVTGATATVADMSHEARHGMVRITVITVVLILLILLLIYRSIGVTLFIVANMALCLALARGATAFLGAQGLLNVSTFTESFLTAVLLGASTDYAIFLVSRYHQLRRDGVEPRQAAHTAAVRVSGVIVGSGLTVILATASMGLARVGLFRTTGPAIAVGVAMALAVTVTLTPGLLATLGARGLLEPRPRRARAREGWQRVAGVVSSRPGTMLGLGLAPLVLLALVFPSMTLTLDERSVQPEHTESNRGYRALDAHFPPNETMADVVLVTADRDLRNPRDLAALERAADALSRVDGVTSVRALTRPDGAPIPQASVGHLAGVASDRLRAAADQVDTQDAEAGRLADGSQQLSDGAGEVAAGADQALDGSEDLLDGLVALDLGLGQLSDGSARARTGSDQLGTGAADLAGGLDDAAARTSQALTALRQVYDALADRSVTCGVDAACRSARDALWQVYVAQRDQLAPGLRDAAAGAHRLSRAATEIETGLGRLDEGLADAQRAASRLAAGQRELTGGLGDLVDGSTDLARGSEAVADGTEQLTSTVARVEAGMTSAADVLDKTARTTRDPAIGGFYLPPSALKDEQFKAAGAIYLSHDGRVARMLVVGDSNPFEDAAMDRADAFAPTVRAALADTRLADSEVLVAGTSATNADIRRLDSADKRLVAIAAAIAVFLVLLLLIRSIVAAALLLAAVLLSYAATMGLSVLIWEGLLDTHIEWTVPSAVFVLLVAVGADYNLLLIKRILEESPDGSADGVRRAVAHTGGVISAAGVIFAASLFALAAGSVTTLAQIGTAAGLGLLIDTFVVRTLVVPAAATLLGRTLWWPSRQRAESAPAELGSDVANDAVQEVRVVVDAQLVGNRQQQRVRGCDCLVLG